MKTRALYLLAIGLLAIPASSFAGEITAEEIIQNVTASYEKQMKDVKDFTIISEVSEGEGEEKSVSTEIEYQKRAKIGDKTVYKRRHELNDGKDISIYDGEYEWECHSGGEVTKEKLDYNPYAPWEALKRIKGEYTGTENIDGYKTYILWIEDMTDMMGLPPEAKKTMKASGKVWVDAKDWIPRKMEMDMEQVDETGNSMGTVKTVMNYEDYRGEHGMLVPYRTSQKISMKINPEMIEKQLQEVPLEYREQAEAQMKEQMGKEQIQITKVKEVKVNTGLSDNLFDGSKLK